MTIALLTIAIFFIIFFTNSISTKKEIHIAQETFYFKNEKRGLNYAMTALSKSRRNKIDHEDKKSFIYPFDHTLFYKIVCDTLFIYTSYIAKYPPKLKTNIVIKQIEIDNLKFIELDSTFKDLQLNKFPEKLSIDKMFDWL